MDYISLSQDTDLSGVYSTKQSVHITEGVSAIACALMCTSYAVCSSIFYNTESKKCILINGFHFQGEQLTQGGYWQYFRPVTKYRVTMTTSTIFAADTDATVFLKILGSKGKTNEFKIEDQNRDLFEKGSIDTFMFESVDVGEVEGIEIHRDNTGNNPGWKLVSVRITKTGGLSLEIEVNLFVPTTPFHVSKSQ